MLLHVNSLLWMVLLLLGLSSRGHLICIVLLLLGLVWLLLRRLLTLLLGLPLLLLLGLPFGLSSLLLRFPCRLFFKDEASFFHVFCHDPSLARSCSVWHCLVLRFHACTLIHVVVISFNVRQVNLFLAVGRSVVTIVVNIIPTQKNSRAGSRFA